MSEFELPNITIEEALGQIKEIAEKNKLTPLQLLAMNKHEIPILKNKLIDCALSSFKHYAEVNNLCHDKLRLIFNHGIYSLYCNERPKNTKEI